ncbi:adenylate cyclase [Rhizobium sp. Root149]|jgi:hypothetical protein|uniref:DUF3095 domain-containing protein n=1 Tax=Rhizobium rhizoryzae TaxID=451876 RepID=A0A7W6LI26_9HYPH|nr:MULTISPECIES: DUF3095 domain-containing protein [Rhizobium]KQZ50673.1 adenylate cyclase [Rhizobium sp. Root149]MBB4143396.1 hypothetical protein [Rhizobium rhizoryzae]
MQSESNAFFYSALPVLTRFEGVTDAENYTPLPGDWFLALADIVGSTGAIAEGRYKDVNMAGASVISAILNVLDETDYPFVFGGDGALVAIPPTKRLDARQALSSVCRWVKEELRLDMRVALVPMTDVRKAGRDVGVARFAASSSVSYAMFNGGGASWAEQQMKAGHFLIEEENAAQPDLTGLSCRWDSIPSQRGQIVSLIVSPMSLSTMNEFRDLMVRLIAITSQSSRDSHPVPEKGPPLRYNEQSIEREAHATATPDKRGARKWAIRMQIWLTILLYRFNLSLGRFNARQYAREVAQNSDFRKFDDGLKMTLDVDADQLAQIRSMLETGKGNGICDYGLHSQDSALMTCLVFNPLSHNHVHFIDGASGGYALAASQLVNRPKPTSP